MVTKFLPVYFEGTLYNSVCFTKIDVLWKFVKKDKKEAKMTILHLDEEKGTGKSYVQSWIMALMAKRQEKVNEEKVMKNLE